MEHLDAPATDPRRAVGAAREGDGGDRERRQASRAAHLGFDGGALEEEGFLGDGFAAGFSAFSGSRGGGGAISASRSFAFGATSDFGYRSRS